MTVTQWAQLALGLVKFANWAASKVDQSIWKQIGYQQAMKAQLDILTKRIELGRKIVSEVEAMTDKELDDELGRGK